jgi:hypothetical protein
MSSEQPERLVEADAVDGVPVLGGDSVLDSEEVGGHEVDRPAALLDGAVPHAERGGPVVSATMCASVRRARLASRRGRSSRRWRTPSGRPVSGPCSGCSADNLQGPQAPSARRKRRPFRSGAFLPLGLGRSGGLRHSSISRSPNASTQWATAVRRTAPGLFTAGGKPGSHKPRSHCSPRKTPAGRVSSANVMAFRTSKLQVIARYARLAGVPQVPTDLVVDRRQGGTSVRQPSNLLSSPFRPLPKRVTSQHKYTADNGAEKCTKSLHGTSMS